MRCKQRLLFGGSFDPPHRGHLGILQYILQKKLADNIDIIPTAVSPFKENTPPHGTNKDRFVMIEKLLSCLDKKDINNTKISLLDIEFNRPSPSYTAETCVELRKRHPGDRIAILIGCDGLIGLERWYHIQKLSIHHQFWIFLRDGVTKTNLEKTCRNLKQSYPNLTLRIFWDSPIISCSSSEIKKYLLKREAKNKICERILTSCLPSNILAYIQSKQLYQGLASL